jgi:copper chaperone NosL
MARREGRGAKIAVAALFLLGLGLLVRAIVTAQTLPQGPEPVAWDRVACARCRMLVSDPRFAAQLQTSDGRTLFFDDPGCLLTYVHSERLERPLPDAEQPAIHAVYFHHVDAERWLSRDEVAFAPVEHTPMGYGLGAREIGAAGTISWESALAHALARSADREGGS